MLSESMIKQTHQACGLVLDDQKLIGVPEDNVLVDMPIDKEAV